MKGMVLMAVCAAMLAATAASAGAGSNGAVQHFKVSITGTITHANSGDCGQPGHQSHVTGISQLVFKAATTATFDGVKLNLSPAVTPSQATLAVIPSQATLAQIPSQATVTIKDSLIGDGTDCAPPPPPACTQATIPVGGYFTMAVVSASPGKVGISLANNAVSPFSDSAAAPVLAQPVVGCWDVVLPPAAGLELKVLTATVPTARLADASRRIVDVKQVVSQAVGGGHVRSASWLVRLTRMK